MPDYVSLVAAPQDPWSCTCSGHIQPPAPQPPACAISASASLPLTFAEDQGPGSIACYPTRQDSAALRCTALLRSPSCSLKTQHLDSSLRPVCFSAHLLALTQHCIIPPCLLCSVPASLPPAPPIYLPIHLSIHLPAYLSTGLPAYPSASLLRNYLSPYLPIYPSADPSEIHSDAVRSVSRADTTFIHPQRKRKVSPDSVHNGLDHQANHRLCSRGLAHPGLL